MSRGRTATAPATPRRAAPSSGLARGATTAATLAGARSEAREGVADILRAAAEAFMRKGFAATSTDDVAERLGATKGRIYHHFRSKIDLFFAVHQEAMAMVMREVTSAANGERGPVQRLFLMARAHALVIMREIAFQCVVVQGLEMHLHGQTTPQQRETLHDILELRDAYEQLFVAAIDEAVKAGELPRQNTRVVVKAFLGSLNWTTLWYRPRAGEAEAERLALAEDVARFCVRGLGASL